MPGKKQTAGLRVCLHRKNIPEAELLADLRAVAARLNTGRLSRSMYAEHGQFSALTFVNRFGSWARAVRLAGMASTPRSSVSANAFLKDVSVVAKALNTTRLTLEQYQNKGRYNWQLAYARFGSWQAATAAAGLTPGRYPKYTKQMLLENLRDLWLTLGRQPKLEDLALSFSRCSFKPYWNHFGSFNNAMLALDQFMHPRKKPIELKTDQRQRFSRKTSREIPMRMRYVVLRRDRYRCCACGRSPATHAGVNLHIDHKLAWRKGGETIEENLQTLCEQCNGGKSDLAWQDTTDR